jgi:uncharacterized protein
MNLSDLAKYNPWWARPASIERDQTIRAFESQRYRWTPRLKRFIELEQDVIYTIRGPRQVGKTTLIKQIIRELLETKRPENVFFMSYENLEREQDLKRSIETYLDWVRARNEERTYLFLDEISSVKTWAKQLLSLANAGLLENTSIIATGSHAMDLVRGTETLPGRRGGRADEILDKIMLPMKFAEYVELVDHELYEPLRAVGVHHRTARRELFERLGKGDLPEELIGLEAYLPELRKHLERYLITGGIPRTINEFAEHETISSNTTTIYIDAITSQLRRFDLSEHTFKQLITRLFTTALNPVSYYTLKEKTDLHHETVQRYLEAAEELYMINHIYKSDSGNRVQSQSKKFYFSDPYILHTMRAWMKGDASIYPQANETLTGPLRNYVLEGVLFNHLARVAFSYEPHARFDPKSHITFRRTKSGREIDFVLNDHLGFESKNTTNITPSDYEGLKNLGHGCLVNPNTLATHKRFSAVPYALILAIA